MVVNSELLHPPVKDCFASDFGELFAQLLTYSDRDSEEFLSAADQVRRYVVDFWKKQLPKQPQEAGSFGSDQSGSDQLALCMTINTPSELSICKWGLEENENSERLPKMDILSSIDNNGHPQWVFNIDIHGNLLQMTRTDLRPKKMNEKTRITVNFQPIVNLAQAVVQ